MISSLRFFKLFDFSKIFLIFYLFGLVGGAATLWGGSKEYQVYWLILYAVNIVFFIANKEIYLYKYEVAVVLFFLYVIISSFWSSMPINTFLYSISLFANIVFCIFCVRLYSFFGFFSFVLKFINYFILIGLLLACVGVEKSLYYDSLGRSNLLGTALVKGLFSHKIYAGVYSVIALYWNLYFKKNYNRLFWAAICLLSVFLSGSSLAMFLLFIGFFALILLVGFKNKNSRTKYLAPLFILSLQVVFIFYLKTPMILEFLGRDMSLTGRTGLWEWALHFFMEKPVLGWGYSGIFSSASGAPSDIITSNQYYHAPHFHNSYLQILAEIGVVGFVMVMMFIIPSFLNGWRYYWSGRREYFFSTYFFIAIFIVGSGMNVMFRYNEITTVLLFMIILYYRRSGKLIVGYVSR